MKEVLQTSKNNRFSIDQRGAINGFAMTSLPQEVFPLVTPEIVATEATALKYSVAPHLLRGAEMFQDKYNVDDLGLNTDQKKQAWLWALKSSRYNAIYFVSRKEAQEGRKFVKENAELIDRIGNVVDQSGGAAGIISYGIHNFVLDMANTGRKEVRFENGSVPRNAIQGYDALTIYARKDDFLEKSLNDSFHQSEQVYDWHDLGHMLTASSTEGSFGVKSHEGLDTLPQYYQDLSDGVGQKDASGPIFSDGMLFSQLSKPIFEKYAHQKNTDGSNKYTDQQVQDIITRKLTSFLGGNYPLYHPVLETLVSANRSITPAELAICEQNKRYERRASEMDRDLYVRTTPEGPRGDPSRDPLLPLSRSERIMKIAGLGNSLLYFEARNLLRQRAHEDALGAYSINLLGKKIREMQYSTSGVDRVQKQKDISLLQAIVDFYLMEDLKKGKEINLYTCVAEYIS